MDSLSRQLGNLLEHQKTLAKVVKANTDHVLKLQQTVDPLTWKKRAALLFAGAFTGGGTAAFFTTLFLHYLSTR